MVLLLVGAAGKSAQFPLHIWLPDAMAGPTPVSALIHAATMVTAGVYLLTRMNPIIAEAHGWVPDLIMWVGLGTALMAATIAVAQNDIKKVLAYSTVSQLGFMFVAVGSGAYVAAIFHMVTHAFFKALLFLGAGSVIHGMDGDQDIRRYGGLTRLLPITSMTFVAGWLAIAGVPPFSGFWSKDEILAYAYGENKVLWVLLLATAILTAFYMTRLVLMTFFGPPRWAEAEADSTDDTPHRHPHESPWTMTVPLVLLAGLAMVAGVFNLPFTSDVHFLGNWLKPSLFGNEGHLPFGGGTQWVLALVAIVGSLGGVSAGAAVYIRRRIDPARIEHPFLARAWRIDEIVTNFMGGPGRRAFERTTQFDEQVVDGAVNATGTLIRRGGTKLRVAQSGLVRSYALGIAIGAVALLAWFISRAGF